MSFHELQQPRYVNFNDVVAVVRQPYKSLYQLSFSPRHHRGRQQLHGGELLHQRPHHRGIRAGAGRQCQHWRV